MCREADVWLHIDAAYAGSSFICPEFRPLLDGIEVPEKYMVNLRLKLSANQCESYESMQCYVILQILECHDVMTIMPFCKIM